MVPCMVRQRAIVYALAGYFPVQTDETYTNYISISQWLFSVYIFPLSGNNIEFSWNMHKVDLIVSSPVAVGH